MGPGTPTYYTLALTYIPSADAFGPKYVRYGYVRPFGSGLFLCAKPLCPQVFALWPRETVAVAT